MDINKLYTQAGSIGQNDSFKFTKLIENIPVSENPFPDYYNLGFCRHYFPQVKTTQISYNAETLEVAFNDITDYSSYPSIGIGAHAYSFAQGLISNFSYFDDTQKFDYTTAGNKRLTNNVDMMAWSMRWVYLNFAELGYATNTYIYQEQKTLTIAQFMEFLDGNSTIDFTIGGTTYNLHRSDFIDDYYYEIDDTHRIILFNYQFDGAWYFDGNTEQTRNYRPDYFLQSPYVLLDDSYSAITFGQNLNVQSSGVCAIQYRNSVVSMYSGYSKTTLHGGESGHALTTPIIGGATGKFNVNDPELNTTGSWKIISDESADRPTYVSLWRNASIYPYGILTAVKFDDVYKNAALYRWTSVNVYGYGDGTNVWFPKIDLDTNEYLLELIQGTEEEIEPQLPLWWKIGNIQANDYVDDDKPTPSGKGEDDPISKPNDPGKREGKITGDVVGLGGTTRVQALSGINYYLLKQSDMTLLRSLLWSQSKTFYQALNIINSVGTDTIFNYFSSLRYYPISNLLNYFTHNPNNPDSANVVLGNGAVLQGPDGYFSCKIPNSKVYQGLICGWYLSSLPWRDNFLDYSPYSKIVLTLPYCGDIEVDINRIAAYRAIKDIHLYVGVIVDIETGTLTYYATTSAGGLNPFEQILFEKQVKLAIDLPLSGNDQIAQSNAIFQSTYKLASTTLQTASSLISSAEKTGKKLALHKAGVGDVASFAASAIQGVMDIGVASAEATLAKRQVPITTGDINGTMSSTITRQYPVLTFYRQKTANPDNYGHTTGYVCEAALTLNSIEAERTRQGIPHAFTVLSNPDLGNVSGATQEELEELMGILTTGFYV